MIYKILTFWSLGLKKIRGAAIRKSKIHYTSKVESGSNLINVTMKCHSFCGYNCQISNSEIGRYVSISNNVKIGGGEHPMNWVGMSPVFYEGKDSVKLKLSEFQRPKPKNVFIGNDVWIGEGAFIKSGVTIGDGAVIGMNSVVTKDVPAYSITAGNPAKELKKRFDDKTIVKLLKMEWWIYPERTLKKYSHCFNNIEQFLIHY